MTPRLGHVARLLAVAVVAATALVLPEPAMAITVPETMADRRPVQAGPVESSFPIDHLGVIWDTPGRSDGHVDADSAPEPHGAVRFRTDGDWGRWIPLVEDGAEGEGQWASGLVTGGDADAYQVRGIPADAGSPRAVAINTTDGPEVKVGERRGGAASALDSAMCRSRADWGADESIRDWDPEFHPVQALTVHHTATANDDPDPAATVRAIYRYHAVDQGWGDIGYQYLIDEQGVVYEGRWSGTASTSCVTAKGDGSDFGHEDETDRMVTGGHAGGYNSGNMGVALL
ncbi:MAG: N-acetylmuramoyl-L-alanine amidase, partial [Dermatophilaceae bacterium]